MVRVTPLRAAELCLLTDETQSFTLHTRSFSRVFLIHQSVNETRRKNAPPQIQRYGLCLYGIHFTQLFFLSFSIFFAADFLDIDRTYIFYKIYFPLVRVTELTGISW